MRARSYRIAVVALLAILSLTSAAIANEQATPSASPVASPQAVEHWPSWTQIGPSDTLLARAIRASECPEIVIDGVPSSMDLRAGPDQDHPNVVCETVIPPGTASITIEGAALPTMTDDPNRIALIGDTGCRMKAPDDFQACNDPGQWPFRQVAAKTAGWDPDLVIHVGDYLYRESPCPAGNAGCAGSPHGDNWTTWNADFFEPVGPLLDAAPWIFIRGNHEDCTREGTGWFRYLDPRPLPTECQPYTDPYAVTIGGVRGVVLDVASAQDTKADPSVTAAFEPILEQALALAGDGPAWLLTHRPIWSIGAGRDGAPVLWSTATYDQSGFSAKSGVFDLVIAGHVHMAQLLSFTAESGRPPQLIGGGGGTQLDDFGTGTFAAGALNTPELLQGWRWQAFGTMTVQPIDTGFVVGVRLLDGSEPATCLSVGPNLACLPG